jgi:hypothetical protein
MRLRPAAHRIIALIVTSALCATAFAVGGLVAFSGTQ